MDQQGRQRANRASVVGSPEQEQLQAEWGAHVKDLLAAYIKKTGAPPNLSLRGATGYGCNYLQPKEVRGTPEQQGFKPSCYRGSPEQLFEEAGVGAGGNSSSSPGLTAVEFERLQLGYSGNGVNDHLSETSGRWRAVPGDKPGRWLRDGPPAAKPVQQMDPSGAQQAEWTSEDDTGGETSEGEERGGPSAKMFNNGWDEEDEETILRRLMWIKYHVKVGNTQAAQDLGWDGDLDYIFEGDEEEEEDEEEDEAQTAQVQAVQTAQREAVYFSCDRCDYKGINAFFLKTHMAEVHGIQTPDPVPSGKEAQAQAQASAKAPGSPPRGQAQAQARSIA